MTRPFGADPAEPLDVRNDAPDPPRLRRRGSPTEREQNSAALSALRSASRCAPRIDHPAPQPIRGHRREEAAGRRRILGFVPGINQHYLPKFLQRRFGVNPQDKKTKVFRLDTRTGACRKANPRNEAAERHYYRLVDEDGVINDDADEFLDSVESRAAAVIQRLVSAPNAEPLPEDLVTLALFVATMKSRTPEGRADLADADVEFGKLAGQRLFSDPEAVRRGLPPGATDQEVEATRQRLLDDLRDGRIYFESSPTRELGMMFAALPSLVEWLISEGDWTVLVAPADRQLVLSDAPVAHYDPAPRADGAGAGFASSPDAMTFVPIDPRVGLLIRPSSDRLLNWRSRPVDRDLVDDLNLLTYAQAGSAIFGSSQEIVTGVRRDARRNRARVAEYGRRRPRIWVTEIGPDDEPGRGGVRKFRSTNRDGTVERRMYVNPTAEREARRRAV